MRKELVIYFIDNEKTVSWQIGDPYAIDTASPPTIEPMDALKVGDSLKVRVARWRSEYIIEVLGRAEAPFAEGYILSQSADIVVKEEGKPLKLGYVETVSVNPEKSASIVKVAIGDEILDLNNDLAIFYVGRISSPFLMAGDTVTVDLNPVNPQKSRIIGCKSCKYRR